jgi:hypothetical protein
MSTFGREEDYAWFMRRYFETGDIRYLRLAVGTRIWLLPGRPR